MKSELKRKFDKLILNTFYISLVTACIFIVAEIGARAYLVYDAKNLMQHK